MFTTSRKIKLLWYSSLFFVLLIGVSRKYSTRILLLSWFALIYFHMQFTVCLDHSFTRVIWKLLALYQVSFYVLPFSYFKEGKYKFFTFLWKKPGIMLILPNTSTIKTLCPLVSSASVFLQSLPLIWLLVEWPFQQQWLPQNSPYELLHLLVWEEVGTSLPNTAMAQRYRLTHFSPCSPTYEPHS